jgi:hypothetical protein
MLGKKQKQELAIQKEHYVSRSGFEYSPKKKTTTFQKSDPNIQEQHRMLLQLGLKILK